MSLSSLIVQVLGPLQPRTEREISRRKRQNIVETGTEIYFCPKKYFEFRCMSQATGQIECMLEVKSGILSF